MSDFVSIMEQLAGFVQNERVKSYNEGVDAERASEGDYYKKAYGHFVAMLAERYAAGEALDIANLCDDKLDHSGRLLGAVRAAAMALNGVVGGSGK